MQTVYRLIPNLYHDTIKYIDEMIPVIGDCVCQIAIEENPKEDPDEIDNNMKVWIIVPFFKRSFPVKLSLILDNAH